MILNDRKSARVEHRRPGADANPYIVAAAILAAVCAACWSMPTYPREATSPPRCPATCSAR